MEKVANKSSGKTSSLSNYRMGKVIGRGSFCKVKMATHKMTGHDVAIKIIDRCKLKNSTDQENIKREINILKSLEHPHIIRLYEVIETKENIYIVMEYLPGGELFDYILQKGRLQDDEARKFFQQIISGVAYCHMNMVVHRDLKPENILIDSSGNVKLADFGLSNIMKDGHLLNTCCGSPNFAAPEVISSKLYAGPEVDVWSCGVILYALLCGIYAFDDENIPSLYKKIKSGMYTLPRHLSPGAKDLISRMLVVNPVKRITIPEIYQHQWFKPQLPLYLANNVRPRNGPHIPDQHNDLSADEMKWHLGLQSPNSPFQIMTKVLGALQELNVKWKKIGAYKLKCLWVPAFLLSEGLGSNNGYIANNVRPRNELKFELQLYRTPVGTCLLDLQSVSGEQMVFLNFCSVLITQLNTRIA